MSPKPYLPFLFLLVPFIVWPQETPGYWVSKPASTTLVIIGVSNRRLRGEGEIESAQDDAARKLRMYHGLTGTIRTVVLDEPGPWGFRMIAETRVESRSAADFQSLRETLVFDREKDVFRTDSAVFVRFTCAAPGIESLDYEPTVFVNGEPLWIHRPIREIAGHITGLGFSGPQRYLKDTINKSCENAAAALIVSTSAQMETLDRDEPGRRAASRITETSAGELTGFLVLEMWIDPKTKAVWTLAAAKKEG